MDMQYFFLSEKPLSPSFPFSDLGSPRVANTH